MEVKRQILFDAVCPAEQETHILDHILEEYYGEIYGEIIWVATEKVARLLGKYCKDFDKLPTNGSECFNTEFVTKNP